LNRHRDTHVRAAPSFEPSYKQSTEDARRLLTGNADISATATYTLAVKGCSHSEHKQTLLLAPFMLLTGLPVESPLNGPPRSTAKRMRGAGATLAESQQSRGHACLCSARGRRH